MQNAKCRMQNEGDEEEIVGDGAFDVPSTQSKDEEHIVGRGLAPAG
ncbi:MAG: hypothetical protein IJW53_06165 [Clostridia bacterium]|nr:hypothetical protein [Clostridia bacterium]